jgi:hypothetical protein
VNELSRDRLRHLVSRQQFGLLAAVFMACAAVFTHRETLLWSGRPTPAEARAVPDARLGYTSSEVRAYFDAIGPRGRGLYVATQLTVDLIFPLLYGLLLAVLLAHLFPRPTWWVGVPVAAAAADLGENFLLTGLACTFNDSIAISRAAIWATAAAACLTVTKWALLAATALGVLVGLAYRAREWLRAPRGT